MPLRVLALGEFDPAGVLCGWREALRVSGADVQLRVALRWSSRPQHQRADWLGHTITWGAWPTTPMQRLDRLHGLLEEADLIVLNPGIGQPWACSFDSPFVSPREEYAWVPDMPRKPVIHVIHGSRATWSHRAQYAMLPTLATTTLDYAHELGAVYVPPALSDVWGVARERGPIATPRVLQATTDPANCHTAGLKAWAAQRRVDLQIVEGRLHPVTMAYKLGASIGFDHLRGSFAVNTAEFALLGLAPACLLRPEYRTDDVALDGLPETIAPTEAAVWAAMDRLVLDPDWHQEIQRAARQWALRLFNPAAVAQRLVTLFRSAA